MRKLKLIAVTLLAIFVMPSCRIVTDLAQGFTIKSRGKGVTSGGRLIVDGPLPNVRINGRVLSPGNGLFGSYNKSTDGAGRFYCAGCMTDTYWEMFWQCPGYIDSFPQIYVGFQHTVNNTCFGFTSSFPSNSARFSIYGATPPSIVLAGSGLTTVNGMPILNVFSRDQLVATVTATSVASNGTSATFPYPTQTNGSPLPSNIYAFTVSNYATPNQTYCEPMYDEWGNYLGDNCWEQPGELELATFNFGSIAAPTVLTSPFGVSASYEDVQGLDCYREPYGEPSFNNPYFEYGPETCNSWSYSTQSPVVTLSTPGQLYSNGQVLQVGSNPTSVQVYRQASQFLSWGDGVQYRSEQTTTRPSRAMVVNSSSNSVSIVDLVNWQIVTTVAVGARPHALAIDPGETKGYVANHDSNTISEIDLATNTVSRTVTVSSRPAALAIDSSTNSLWVGGQGWMMQLALNTLNPISTYSVDGSVTSIVKSNGANGIVYTAVSSYSYPSQTSAAAPEFPNDTNYSVRRLNLTNSSTSTTIVASASSYTYTASGSALPTPTLLAGGSWVSTAFGNAISVSATPTGFVIMDVDAGTEIMRGITSSPIRGIAVGREDSVIYLTLTDGNQLLSVPLVQ